MSKEDTAEAVSFDDVMEFDGDDIIDEDHIEVESETVDTAEPEKEAEETEKIELIEPPEFFSAEHKEYFQKLQELEGGRDYAQQWHNQWAENQKYITQKSQSVAEEKRQYEQQLQEYNQYQQALQPINEIWQRQGIAPAIGVAQMAYYGKLLHTDPQALINEVAQFASIDLNQLVEEQPYVDPTVRTVQQENQQLKQAIENMQQQFQQGQQNQSAQANTQIVTDFSNSKDADGGFLYPHMREDSPHCSEVSQAMMYWMTAPHSEIARNPNPVQKLEQAYQKAVSVLPEVQAAAREEQEKATIAAKQAEVQKAKKAATRTDSKTKDAPKAKKTLKNMYDDVFDDD